MDGMVRSGGFRGKKALVTGGAGFLGSHLCRRLIAEGYSVIALDNLSTGSLQNLEEPLQGGQLQFIHHDVIEPYDAPVDLIFNFACCASPVHYQAQPVQTLKTCLQGTINMLELARRRGARIFQASTSEVYGEPEVHPQEETYRGAVSITGPRACYDEGKRCAETLFFEYHRTYGVDIKIARIFNTYGPRMRPDDGRAVSNLIVQALRHEPMTVYGDGSQTRSFCYVDDLIDGIMRLVETPESVTGPFNIGNPHEVTVQELAERIRAITGSRSPIVHEPIPVDDPTRRCPDISLARRYLDWEPRVPLEEGLRRTLAWFAGQQPQEAQAPQEAAGPSKAEAESASNVSGTAARSIVVPRERGNGGAGPKGRVLITGGAGFVGSHLADELLAHGYQVRVLDALLPQVHGEDREWPDYLSSEVERIEGDVRDADLVRQSLAGCDAVFHLAAAVGVGQSMYEIEHYTDVNNRGTAVLLEALAQSPVARLVVASSMSVYGEGLYTDADGRTVSPPERAAESLRKSEWELLDAKGRPLTPVPTSETKITSPSSVYALSKLDQEKLCLIVGQAYGIPTTALRFFNIYGTRQALSNPYTGVLAIFASRYLNGKPPLIFEDGRQRRDFVHVKDIARACRLALETPASAGLAINVGSGQPISILEIAEAMAHALDRDDLPPAEVTGRFRTGDIRHCFADISLAQEVLGYRPQVSLEEGMAELVEWMGSQRAADRTEVAVAELARRGLQL